ncbi:MAG: hypothetical protein A2428_15820 [Bdellovibrionales bacterium RIFOXYC1_FULL_54_43]|nr:MAG: hypothetical protein A2428_15820 [Bdellovibrionales bacterium RIFOXYC1_FULL_54_43]OFZ85386.1 MAG: hypothetical protein A2603_00740 [Bdellovibrionales bacterium RIFOXYD1_FULL_55_31]
METKKQTKGLQEETAKVAGQAQERIHETKERLGSAVESRKSMVSEKLDHFCDAIRQASDSLRHSNENQIAGYLDQLADRTDSFNRSIKDRRTSDMFQEVQNYARNNPLASFAAAAGIGILVSRIGKVAFSRRSAREVPPMETHEDYLERRIG